MSKITDEELAALGLTAKKRGPKKGSSNARTEANRAKISKQITKAEEDGEQFVKVTATGKFHAYISDDDGKVKRTDKIVSDDAVKGYVDAVLSDHSGWEYVARTEDKSGRTVFLLRNSGA